MPSMRRLTLAVLWAAILSVVAGAPSGLVQAQETDSDPPPPVTGDAFSNGQRAEGWRADLKTLAAELPKLHVNLFATLTKEQWEQAVAQLNTDIPNLSDDAITVRLMQLVNLAGDSHTAVQVGPQAGFRFYPLGLYWFDDGIYVVQTKQEFKDLLGARLTAIDGQPIADVVKACATVIPHENESQLRSQAPLYIVMAEILSSLGITTSVDSARFSLALRSGQEGAIELTPLVPSRDTKYVQVLDPATPGPYYTHQADQQYFTEWVPLSNTMYLAYNQCAQRPDLPIADLTKQVLQGLDGLPEGRLVIDLRNNSGGDSSLLDPLIDALAARKDVNRRGHLFVLLGRRTFSSAVLNALSLKDKTQAIFVGEPTGGKPSHFGEVKQFKLPISGLAVTYSTKFFDYHGDTSPSLMPDVPVAEKFEDYLAGRDVVFATATEWKP